MLSSSPGGCCCLVAPVGAAAPDFFALAAGAVAAAGTSFARGELTHGGGVIRPLRSSTLRLDLCTQPPAVLAAQAYKGRYHEVDLEGDGWAAYLLRACVGLCDGRGYGSGAGQRPCSAFLRDVTDFLVFASSTHKALGPAALPSPLVRLFVFDASPELMEHVAGVAAQGKGGEGSSSSSSGAAPAPAPGKDPLHLVRFVTGRLQSDGESHRAAPAAQQPSPRPPFSEALLMTLRLFLSEVASGVASGLDLEYTAYDALLGWCLAGTEKGEKAGGAGGAAPAPPAFRPGLLSGVRGGCIDAFLDPAAVALVVPGLGSSTPSPAASSGSTSTAAVSGSIMSSSNSSVSGVAETRRRLIARTVRHQAALCVLGGAPTQALEVLDSKWKPPPGVGAAGAQPLLPPSVSALSSYLGSSSSFSADPLWAVMALLTRLRVAREAAAAAAAATSPVALGSSGTQTDAVARSDGTSFAAFRGEVVAFLKGLLTPLEDALPPTPPLVPLLPPAATTAPPPPQPAAATPVMTAAGVAKAPLSTASAASASSEAGEGVTSPVAAAAAAAAAPVQPSWSTPHPAAFLADPTVQPPPHTPTTALLQATTAIRGGLLCLAVLPAGASPGALPLTPTSADRPAPAAGGVWLQAWATLCGGKQAHLNAAVITSLLQASAVQGSHAAALRSFLTAGLAAAAGAGGASSSSASSSQQQPLLPPVLSSAGIGTALPAAVLSELLSTQYVQASYLQDPWLRVRAFAGLAAAAAACGLERKAEAALGLALTALRCVRAEDTALPGLAAAEGSEASTGLHAWYGGGGGGTPSAAPVVPEAMSAALCCALLAQRSAALARLFAGIDSEEAGASLEREPGLPLIGAANPSQFAPASLCGALTDAVMGAVGYLPHGERAKPRLLRDAGCALLATQLGCVLAAVEAGVRARPAAAASLGNASTPPLPAVAYTSARLLQCLPPAPSSEGGAAGAVAWRPRPLCGADRCLRLAAAAVINAASSEKTPMLALLGVLATSLLYTATGCGPSLPSAVGASTGSTSDPFLTLVLLGAPLSARGGTEADSVASALWGGGAGIVPRGGAPPRVTGSITGGSSELVSSSSPPPPSLRLLAALSDCLWGVKAAAAGSSLTALCLPLSVAPVPPPVLVACALVTSGDAATLRRHAAAAVASDDVALSMPYAPGTLVGSESRRVVAALLHPPSRRLTMPALNVGPPLGGEGSAAAGPTLLLTFTGIPWLCRPPSVAWSVFLSARITRGGSATSLHTIAAPLAPVDSDKAPATRASRRSVAAWAALAVPCEPGATLELLELRLAAAALQVAVWAPAAPGACTVSVPAPVAAPVLPASARSGASTSAPPSHPPFRLAPQLAAQVPLFGSAWALAVPTR